MAEKKKPEEELRLTYSFDHGVNFEDRVIRITGEIEEGSFDALDASLSELERKSRSRITIRICSPGGSVYDALAMAGRMRTSRCQIVTEGYGHVMSAAVLLLAAGDKRRISKFCTVLHHQTSNIVGGPLSEMRDEVEQMEKEERLWCRWMEELSNKSAKWWYKSAEKKNVYLSAEECLKLGVVDAIL